MIDSKVLKEAGIVNTWIDPNDLSFFGKAGYYLKRWLWRDPKHFVSHYVRKFHTAYQYASFSWNNYDWDFSYVYWLIHFKLKRVYKTLENGCGIQESEDMKALKDLTKIVYRLARDRYEYKYFRQHDKYWGKIESQNIPEYDENGEVKWYHYESWRKNCPKDANEKTKKREYKERKLCYKLGEKDRCGDIDRLAEILKKNSPKFWD